MSFITPSASAWRHGRPGGYDFANTVAQYDITRQYSTTDWLADGVIHRLALVDSHQFYWLMDFWYEYMLGTEFIGGDETNDGQVLTYNDTEIRRLDNEMDMLLVWTLENGPILGGYSTQVMDIVSKLQEALLASKYDVASIYFGIYVGYFMLSVDWWHYVYPDANFKTNYDAISLDIHEKTHDAENPEKYFEWAKITHTYVKTNDPWVCIQRAANATLFDAFVNGTQPLMWVINEFSYTSRSPDKTSWDARTSAYYTQIAHIFSYAVAACADSIGWILANASITIPPGITNPRPKTIAMVNTIILWVLVGGGSAMFLTVYLLLRRKVNKQFWNQLQHGARL